MDSAVLDTHTTVWYLLRSTRLSSAGYQRMEAALRDGNPLFVPSICIVELIYLVEKGRIPLAQWDDLQRMLLRVDAPLRIWPLDEEVARSVALIPRTQVPDMPDRIIAATALHLRLPLVSRDPHMRCCGIDVVW